MPHILSGARAIGGSVISEEGMACIGVHLELVGLTVLVQFLAQPFRVRWRWISVLLPKKGEKRTCQVCIISMAATGRASVGPSSGMMCLLLNPRPR